MQVIPLSKTANIYVAYGGGSLKFGVCQWNNNMRCWLTDISYMGVEVLRVPLRSGTNILKQFALHFGILVVNRNSPSSDPGSFNSIAAYILDADEIGSIV